jgi:hypothetical protein
MFLSVIVATNLCLVELGCDKCTLAWLYVSVSAIFFHFKVTKIVDPDGEPNHFNFQVKQTLRNFLFIYIT